MTGQTNDPTKTSISCTYENLSKLIDSVSTESRKNRRFLKEAAQILARTANRMTQLSMATKVAIIFLGAVAATSGTFSAVYGKDNPWVIWFFTIVGVVIATLSGIDAAFKLEPRSSGRNLLAGQVTAKLYWYHSQFNEIFLEAKLYSDQDTIEVEAFNDLQQRLRDELTHQVKYIQSVNEKAAELNVNLKWESRNSQEETREYESQVNES